MKKIEIENKIDELNKEILKLSEIKEHIKEFECVVLLTPDIQVTDFEELKKDIEDIVTIENFQNIGKKKMAYTVKNHIEAYYIEFDFEGTTHDCCRLETIFRLNDNVLKYLTVKLD